MRPSRILTIFAPSSVNFFPVGWMPSHLPAMGSTIRQSTDHQITLGNLVIDGDLDVGIGTTNGQNVVLLHSFDAVALPRAVVVVHMIFKRKISNMFDAFGPLVLSTLARRIAS